MTGGVLARQGRPGTCIAVAGDRGAELRWNRIRIRGRSVIGWIRLVKGGRGLERCSVATSQSLPNSSPILNSKPKISMALIMNDYHPTNMAGTIRRHERREHAHSWISGSMPYPSVASLVSQMENPNRGQDTLSEFYNSDALFRFAIGAAVDIWEQVAQRVQQ